MYNEKSKFTRLTLDQSDLHIEWSVPYEDVSGEDMMQAIRTLMIGMTFSDITVESSMASYLEEHSDQYVIYDKDGGEKVEDIDKEDICPSPEEYENSIKPHFYA